MGYTFPGYTWIKNNIHMLFTDVERSLDPILDHTEFTINQMSCILMVPGYLEQFPSHLVWWKYHIHYLLTHFLDPKFHIVFVCKQASKMGYTYPKYTWIINDWYTAYWWTAAEDNSIVNCTDDELEDFLDKVLILHSLPAAVDYFGPTNEAGIVSQYGFMHMYYQQH